MNEYFKPFPVWSWINVVPGARVTLITGTGEVTRRYLSKHMLITTKIYVSKQLVSQHFYASQAIEGVYTFKNCHSD